MSPWNRDFRLVFPRPAKFTHCAGKDSAGFGINEWLRHLVFSHSGRVAGHDCHDVGRLAIDGYLTRPRKRWPSILTFQGSPAILGHFIFRPRITGAVKTTIGNIPSAIKLVRPD
jgi:hypothetical protein